MEFYQVHSKYKKLIRDICGELCVLILYLLDRGHNFEDIILDIVYKLV